MIIIRPITEKDAEAFINIAFTAGIGMTSMPKNRKLLEKRINDSINAFKDPSSNNTGTYLFVLEDLESGVIGGTCGIAAKTGVHSPISFYDIKKQEQHNGIGVPNKIVSTLHVSHHTNHWSEICSLYLMADYRHSGIARLLSLSRFLFIAAFPERFEPMIFAEMRGQVDENQISPFWEGVGKHFVDMTFEALMHLRDEGIHDLSQAVPMYPIYIDLLPRNVQEAIGTVHEKTKPALYMLIQEGFAHSSEFDICDGGPKIEAATKNIRTIQESQLGTIAEITQEIETTPLFILSNATIDFRACYSPIRKLPAGGLVIPAEVAKALKLKVGDKVRYVSSHKETSE
ncbi:MAG TPA: arginine N-succinyltransferase [Parachlamydiaceae bacterium]|nr:arginine N-succinyltransferase [Parachlamydiaceae bacterium]